MPSASTAAAVVPAGSLSGEQEQAVLGELALLHLSISSVTGRVRGWAYSCCLTECHPDAFVKEKG